MLRVKLLSTAASLALLVGATLMVPVTAHAGGSNVAVVDPKTKKPTRVGFREETVTKDGVSKTVRVRYAKKSGENL